jgi:hypothetical protein
MSIKEPFSALTCGPKWRESYRAALFEEDQQKLQLRIDEASTALILRSRVLFATSGDGSNDEEAEAIDDAFYALRALRNCMKMKTRESAAA